jgi:hypothetical protein
VLRDFPLLRRGRETNKPNRQAGKRAYEQSEAEQQREQQRLLATYAIEPQQDDKGALSKPPASERDRHKSGNHSRRENNGAINERQGYAEAPAYPHRVPLFL